MTPRYRTVWISDLHLGSRGCRADLLSRFLKRVRCDRLYLVGDVVDLSRLRGRWYWPAEHNDVVRRLLNHARHGAEVVMLPGNHDDAARQFHGLEMGGVKLLPWAVHVTADGRRLLVIHGDQFDLVVTHSRLLSTVGGIAYDWLLTANRWWNATRRALGKPPYSLAGAIKGRVKSACKYISRFEEQLLHEARRRGLNGVVCGHIHRAEVRDIAGLTYFNCGDWVESCTALVEHADGRVELIDAHAWLEIAEAEHAAGKRNGRRLAEDPLEQPFEPTYAEGEDCDEAELVFGEGMPNRLAGLLSAAGR